MTFHPARLLCWLVASALICVVATPAARAEDEGGPAGSSVEDQVKQQMEKILKLMKKNQEALLKLSTGSAAEPDEVDVDVDPPPSGEGAAGGGGGDGTGTGASGGDGDSPSGGAGQGAEGTEGAEGGAGTAGGRGEAIRRKLEEIIDSQQSGSRRIPSEIEKLLEMIPQGSSAGGPPRQHKQGEQPKPGEPQPRDGRERKPGEEREPGDDRPDRPRDAEDRVEGDRDPEDPESGEPRDDDVPAWQASLPPQMRDALQNQEWEKIPPRYRELVKRYLLWISKNQAPGR